MKITTKQDLSVIYWLKDLFPSGFVKIVDEYHEDSIEVPSIAVETGTTLSEMFELGNNEELLTREYILDIYAKNIQQRNEIAYTILDALKNKVPVYDYDEGFPPSVSPTKIGCLNPIRKRIRPIKIIPELVDEMFYRSIVTLEAIYNPY